jgi:hypothetical protein
MACFGKEPGQLESLSPEWFAPTMDRKGTPSSKVVERAASASSESIARFVLMVDRTHNELLLWLLTAAAAKSKGTSFNSSLE